MHNQSLVSVIIAAYNHENYIQDAIKSVMVQTYKNIELIIIDDGSPDSTFEKMKEIEQDCKKRFNRVVFETKQNEGTCKTYNKLLKKCKGKYVFIMDSDDVVKSNTIKTQVDFMEQNPDYGLCVGDNEIIDAQGKRCYWDAQKNIVYNKKDAKWMTFGEQLKSVHRFVDFNSTDFGSYDTLFDSNYIPNGYLIRAKALKDFEYTTAAPLEDWFLMLQLAKKWKFKYIDSVLHSYRWHATNTIKQTEKMRAYSIQTQRHEIEILKHIDVNSCLPAVAKTINQKILYKKIKFLGFLKIEKYRTFNKKQVLIKIFGLPVFKKNKRRI